MIASHGNYGNQDTIEEVKSRFQKHMDGTEALTSDLKSAVFTMVLADGDENTFDQLVKVSALCMCACEHVHVNMYMHMHNVYRCVHVWFCNMLHIHVHVATQF